MPHYTERTLKEPTVRSTAEYRKAWTGHRYMPRMWYHRPVVVLALRYGVGKQEPVRSTMGKGEIEDKYSISLDANIVSL